MMTGPGFRKYYLPVLSLLLLSLQARASDPLKDAEARIQKYRMREVVLALKDKGGNPIKGVRGQARMERHQFLFGGNLFLFEQFPTRAKNERYLKLWAGLFNYATLPFYFPQYEPKPGRTQEYRLREMTDWCRWNKVTIKGHPLIWHEIWGNPDWIPKEPEKLEPILKKRVENLVIDFPEIQYWDLINEPTTAWRHSTPIALWQNQIGPVEAARRARNWFQAANSDAKYLLNDYNVWKYFGIAFFLAHPIKAIKTLLNPVKHYSFSYYAYLQELKKQGIAPDAIGIQSHMHMGKWPMTRVWKLCETYAKLGLPIHFTETTVLSGKTRRKINYWDAEKNRPWPSTRKGEQNQAEYVEKFYTLLFSHPAVSAITWWDLSDKDAWLNAPAGLVRADLTPKPAYQALHRLIREKWWTNYEGRSDEQGELKFRGFCGDYRLDLPAEKTKFQFQIDCRKPEGQRIEFQIPGKKF